MHPKSRGIVTDWKHQPTIFRAASDMADRPDDMGFR
jgi:hypothetical protein